MFAYVACFNKDFKSKRNISFYYGIAPPNKFVYGICNIPLNGAICFLYSTITGWVVCVWEWVNESVFCTHWYLMWKTVRGQFANSQILSDSDWSGGDGGGGSSSGGVDGFGPTSLSLCIQHKADKYFPSKPVTMDSQLTYTVEQEKIKRALSVAALPMLLCLC